MSHGTQLSPSKLIYIVPSGLTENLPWLRSFCVLIPWNMCHKFSNIFFTVGSHVYRSSMGPRALIFVLSFAYTIILFFYRGVGIPIEPSCPSSLAENNDSYWSAWFRKPMWSISLVMLSSDMLRTLSSIAFISLISLLKSSTFWIISAVGSFLIENSIFVTK